MFNLSALWGLAQCELCFRPSSRALFLCEDCLARLPVSRQSCALCALEIASGELCLGCALAPPSLDAAFCSYLYRPPIDHWMRRFKDGHSLNAKAKLSFLLLERQPSFNVDALTYVPSSTWHLLKRGFNPAQYLAQSVAKAWQVPILHQALVRQGGADQRHLGRRARFLNSQKSLRAGNLDLSNKRILLVDDVLTTGATANAAARALKEQGAAQVSLWALARACP